jgi:hypothetical protein
VQFAVGCQAVVEPVGVPQGCDGLIQAPDRVDGVVQSPVCTRLRLGHRGHLGPQIVQERIAGFGCNDRRRRTGSSQDGDEQQDQVGTHGAGRYPWIIPWNECATVDV